MKRSGELASGQVGAAARFDTALRSGFSID
jgi:hypothetical protein